MKDPYYIIITFGFLISVLVPISWIYGQRINYESIPCLNDAMMIKSDNGYKPGIYGHNNRDCIEYICSKPLGDGVLFQFNPRYDPNDQYNFVVIPHDYYHLIS